MSFDKLHKWWNRQSAIVVVYVVVMLLPNVLLAVTEPYSFTTVTASLLMPGAVYLLLAVALRRPGLLMLCSFPLMVLGAFQIVLLYLFGGSIIAVDMFTNLFTTNASEAGELLGNIWPSIVFVIVLYVPLIVLAARCCLGTGFPPRSVAGRRSGLWPHWFSAGEWPVSRMPAIRGSASATIFFPST